MMGTVHRIPVDVLKVSNFIRFVGCSGGAGPAWEHSEVYLVPCEYMYLTHPLNTPRKGHSVHSPIKNTT